MTYRDTLVFVYFVSKLVLVKCVLNIKCFIFKYMLVNVSKVINLSVKITFGVKKTTNYSFKLKSILKKKSIPL